MNGALPGALTAALEAWYERAARDLPWRRTRDPYAIWVSEIMLQQTRVDTVVPYFQRFMQRFPTVADLAGAPLEEVLRAWSGLGYYRRARQLHLAASEVVERYGGSLPRDAGALTGLSGVGRYTAGAIASIAFGEREALVDGNVARVLARIFALEDDVKSGAGQRRLWELAAALVPEAQPGRFNQALMELGATVCTRDPACERCPVAAACEGHRRGIAHELPRATKKRAPRVVGMIALVAAIGDGDAARVLIGRRRQEGLFGGLWEPPMCEAADLAEARPALLELGVRERVRLEPAGRVVHVLTHRRLEVTVTRARPRRPWRLPEAPAPYDALAWRRPEEAPLSTMARKVLRVALAALLFMTWPLVARADEEQQASGEGEKMNDEERAIFKQLNEPRGGYGRFFLTIAGGKGLRFNNPYRLRTQLGDTPESVSATAGYMDFAVNGAFGDPDGIQHGVALHFSVAFEGVSQQAFSATYLVMHRGGSPLMLYGRIGPTILTAPDPNLGGELGLGAAYFFTGVLGVTAELVGDLFYGAATYETQYTVVPVVSAQLGIIGDFEVLPP